MPTGRELLAPFSPTPVRADSAAYNPLYGGHKNLDACAMSALRPHLKWFLILTSLHIAVVVGGVKAAAQYFSAVTDESPALAGGGIDGILGLAFPPISNLGQVRPYVESYPS